MSQSTNHIDWSATLEINGSNADLALEIITMFKDELPQLKNEITEAWSSDDFMRLAQHVHKLRGSCCYCVCPQLALLGKDIEITIKDQERVPTDEQYSLYVKEIDAVIHELSTRRFGE